MMLRNNCLYSHKTQFMLSVGLFVNADGGQSECRASRGRRAASERFMNDSDNRLNKRGVEIKAGSIYFPSCSANNLSSALSRLNATWRRRDSGTDCAPAWQDWGESLSTRLGRGNDKNIFFTYLFLYYFSFDIFFFVFFLQTGQFAVESSLPQRVAIYEYNHFNKPIELFLRSLDCQTTQQPPLCSKPLFTLSSPTANHLNCLQTTCSFIGARMKKKKEKLFSFIFTNMNKCEK